MKNKKKWKMNTVVSAFFGWVLPFKKCPEWQLTKKATPLILYFFTGLFSNSTANRVTILKKKWKEKKIKFREDHPKW